DAGSWRCHGPHVVRARAAQAAVVLSPEEVARFLEAAPGLKYRAALSAANRATTSNITIPITRRTTERTWPAVSSLDASRAPAASVSGIVPHAAGVREPLRIPDLLPVTVSKDTFAFSVELATMVA